MLKLFVPLLLGLTLAAPVPVIASTVVRIIDGDTVVVKRYSTKTTVRLACIDAPEMAQTPYGKNSKEALQKILPVGSQVSVATITKDRYGRSVGLLVKGERSINLQMVREGQAVVFRKYMDGCQKDKQLYLSAEKSAHDRNLGFWNQLAPVMPWDFRVKN